MVEKCSFMCSEGLWLAHPLQMAALDSHPATLTSRDAADAGLGWW